MSKRPAPSSTDERITRTSSNEDSEEESSPASSVGQPWAKSTTEITLWQQENAPSPPALVDATSAPAEEPSAKYKSCSNAISNTATEQQKAFLLCMGIGLTSEDGSRQLGDLTVEPYCHLYQPKRNPS
ncbi:hypothetical protein SEMRO_71_G039380.1 [Seminavis robusta]|uniref:Uncharacterized protein n=1 Tax=Seminavis robusta TaxID=568900 RepID=A0A9N8DHQ0_9STRA|nr:hypothetical protein SEMRO_71_G039380.1 [Seminavis robusta]|eukprot:Sro71_g039380.1 n/a (128) ;mRNA; f:65905-66288